jgi:hypothetical protein
MAYLRPLKLHFYGFRSLYIIFLLINVLSSIICIEFFKVAAFYIIGSTFFLSLLFSLLLGAYEFHVISDSYLGLKINRRNFYVSSLIFGFLHSLLLVVNFFVISQILNHLENFNPLYFNNLNFYLFMVSIYFFVYAIGNFFSLFLRKINFLQEFLIIVIIFFLILYGSNILSFIVQSIRLLFDIPKDLNIYAGILSVILMITLTINYYKFVKQY